MKKTIAIILARGGSKGIPKKNSKKFCGVPLIAWSISQAMNAKGVSDVWLSSEDEKILTLAKKFGAKTILRPKKLATSTAKADDGYIHAISYIKKNMVNLIASLLSKSKCPSLSLRIFLTLSATSPDSPTSPKVG